jgi:hypothetical protein
MSIYNTHRNHGDHLIEIEQHIHVSNSSSRWTLSVSSLDMKKELIINQKSIRDKKAAGDG